MNLCEVVGNTTDAMTDLLLGKSGTMVLSSSQVELHATSVTNMLPSGQWAFVGTMWLGARLGSGLLKENDWLIPSGMNI